LDEEERLGKIFDYSLVEFPYTLHVLLSHQGKRLRLYLRSVVGYRFYAHLHNDYMRNAKWLLLEDSEVKPRAKL